MRVSMVVLLTGVVFVSGCYRSQDDNAAGESAYLRSLAQQVADLREAMQRPETDRQRAQTEIVRRLDNMEARISRLDSMEARILAVEMKVGSSSVDGNAMSDRNYDEVRRQLSILSERISRIQTAQADVDEGSRQQVDSSRRGSRRSARGCDTATPAFESEAPKESIDDLKRRLRENEMEIKRLREQNPACVLNTIDPPSNIRNTVMKYTTLKDKQYCTKVQITYVRDLFYCSNCHWELSADAEPCCNVSRKKSFYEWRQKRRDVDRTKEIKGKIDVLLKENQEIKERLKLK